VALTKSEMLNKLADATGLKKKEVASVLEAQKDMIVKILKKEKKFKLPDIAIIQVKHRKARKGLNPQTGQPIQIKAKTVLKARVLKTLKDKVL
jgi:DNA-binding protein HU-beta